MAKYKVMKGVHYEPTPGWQGKNQHDPAKHTKYSQGDIVESDRELDKVFEGKFEKCLPGGQELAPTTDVRKQAVQHLILQGHWTEEDRSLLEGMSDVDFQRIQKRSQSVSSPPPEARKKTVSSLGEDVTDNFQRAYDEGLRVFRSPTGKHQVTEASNPTKPVNTKALEAGDVEKFVEKYLKERG